MTAKPHIVIVGAGIIGLSCAYTLASTPGNPFRVTVVAKELTPHTTSDVAGSTRLAFAYIAGGIWGPIWVFPKDKVLKWAAITKDECNRHIQTQEFPVSAMKTQLV